MLLARVAVGTSIRTASAGSLPALLPTGRRADSTSNRPDQASESPATELIIYSVKASVTSWVMTDSVILFLQATDVRPVNAMYVVYHNDQACECPLGSERTPSPPPHHRHQITNNNAITITTIQNHPIQHCSAYLHCP